VHTEHIPKLGWYEWVFVTPSNHRVHHAQNDVYLDRNYGGIFILWDRMFGSFQEELEEEPVIYGIRGPLKSWNPVKALTHVYLDMAQDSWRTARWRDKLYVWVARTGWRPADVAERYPRAKASLADFEKYDPQVPLGVSLYGFFQLIAVIALLLFMQRADPGYGLGVALWALLLATTIVTARWLEGRGARVLCKWEALRLLAFGVLLQLGWRAGYDDYALLAAALYLLLNLLFLVLLWQVPVTAWRAPVTAAQSASRSS
jgi:alkylglycerol monooxygenase